MAMVESPLPVSAGCWGDGGRGALLLQRRRQQQQLIQLEEQEAEHGGGSGDVDHFDRLPDSVLLLVFNRVGDVKALGRCCAVSRRFHALVPQVDSLLVRVDCVFPDDDDAPSSPSSGASSSGYSDKPCRGLFSHLAHLVLGGIVRPLQAIGQILAVFPIGGGGGGVSEKDSSLSSSSAVWDYKRRHPSPHAPAASSPSDAAVPSDVSHHSPTEMLRNFGEIRRLRIELPAGEVGVDNGELLKWKANFGSTLNNCVILGASSVVSSSSAAAATTTLSPVTEKTAAGGANSTNGAGGQLTEEGSCRPDGTAGSPGGGDSGTVPESFYTNGCLKQRVMWTISSLIAASARHHTLQPIVADHGTLESLDLVDAHGQGVLRMDRVQLEELRANPAPTVSGSPQRTLVPALDIRLWHAQQLELSDGMVLQGATLVAIRPSENPATAGNQDMSWVSGAFEEEPYGSAVRQLVKGRMYCLEMNSF